MTAVLRFAICAGVVLALCAPADVLAAKEKFVRTKPHVNVSGPHGMSNEIVQVSVGVVEPGDIGIGVPASRSCRGEVDMRIEEASTGASLATRTGVPLASGTFESTSFASPSASIAVRVVLVARDMEVDGKECVLRGQLEFRGIGTGQTTRSLPIRTEDFVLIKRAS